jgi:hypothetical protein
MEQKMRYERIISLLNGFAKSIQWGENTNRRMNKIKSLHNNGK